MSKETHTPYKTLLAPEIQSFIVDHAHDDVSALALKKPPSKEWPYRLILDQIKARQKAAKKIPLWVECKNVIFPPSDIIEQASSAATARYKAALVEGESFCDLTSGAGVDSCALSEHYARGTCIDQNPDAATLIAHNMPLLTDTPIDVHMAIAEEFLETMPCVDLIMIDPQRRDQNRKGLYKLSDCSPDITALLPQLKIKTRYVMLKTSPMLDISKGIEELSHVSAVHVVEWDGQCKELVFILDFESNIAPDNIPITAVKLDNEGTAINTLTFTRQSNKEATVTYGPPEKFLYEPSPAFQKASGLHAIAQDYNLRKLHTDTHLFTSNTLVKNFPGRCFEIIDILTPDAKSMPIKKANITVRNYPAQPATLYKKLRLQEGGQDTLIACSFYNKIQSKVEFQSEKQPESASLHHKLIWCKKTN